MPDLSVCLGKLARARSAAVLVAKLPQTLGLDADAAADVLVELVAAGLAEVWSIETRQATVVMTALAAGQLWLELTGDGATLRWVPLGKGTDPGPGPGVAAPETDVSPDGGALLDAFTDPGAPDPAVVAEALDAWKNPRERREQLDRLPFYVNPKSVIPMPVAILGLRPRWDGQTPTEGSCPGCGGRPLGLSEVCVMTHCHRSGVDDLLPRVTPRERPRVYRPNDDDGKAGGVGPATAGKLKPSSARARKAGRASR